MKKFLLLPISSILILSCSSEGNYNEETKFAFSYTIASTKIISFNGIQSGICIDKNKDLTINYSIKSAGKLGEDPDKIIKNSYLKTSATNFYFKNTTSNKEFIIKDNSIKKIGYNIQETYTNAVSKKELPENGTYKVTIEVSLREFNGNDYSTSHENIIDHTFSEEIKIGDCTQQ